jgi:hypothetical protein
MGHGILTRSRILFSFSSKHSGSFGIKNKNFYILANGLPRFENKLNKPIHAYNFKEYNKYMQIYFMA